MIKRTIAFTGLVLLLLHASPAFAVGSSTNFSPCNKRVHGLSPMPPYQTALTTSPGTRIARRNGPRITRAEFLRQTIDVFYGEPDQQYTAPYQNMPEDARNAIGVARLVGAIANWGRQANWNAAVTRGEALDIIMRLAQQNPRLGMTTQFRDVRGEHAQRLVKVALEWRLLEPLAHKTFGWSRIITAEEFRFFLERVHTRLNLPLSIPNAQNRGVLDRARLFPERRTRTIPSKRDSSKRTITIEMGSVDRNNNRVNKRELPQNDLLQTVWGLVQEKFLYQERINDDEMAYAMAEALMKQLDDPYTTFLRPKFNTRFQEQINGSTSFFGIGAQVRIHKNGGVEIITPLPGSPAIKAGVHAGDRILEVDGVSVLEMDLNDAVDRIRGLEGVPVRLKIERDGIGGNMIITVVRGEIILKDLTHLVQEGIAVISLNSFSRSAMMEFDNVVKGVMRNDPIGLVLDLRNNPGGLLDAAIIISSHFLQEGDLIVTVDKRDSKKEHRAVGGPRAIPKNLPIVVLVNKGSASASEIVAGALKDHNRAYIIGQTTFGKGSVQEVMEFKAQPNHSSAAVKITIARWLTPDGHLIDGKGIEPTIEVPVQEAGDRDEAMLRAISVIKGKAR